MMNLNSDGRSEQGCSSDVAIHLYSLSTDLNPNWTHSHALQPDIQAYWLDLAHKHELYSNIVFNRTVVSAHWDPRAQKYDIITEDRAGTRSSMSAAILVSAIGLLEIPRFPDIPGMSRFQGANFHAARWDNSISLPGKRVAVIGSGPSAYVPSHLYTPP
jgi:cation diffusion facilitator CzcD-associated flavoprotein CzcO